MRDQRTPFGIQRVERGVREHRTPNATRPIGPKHQAQKRAERGIWCLVFPRRHGIGKTAESVRNLGLLACAALSVAAGLPASGALIPGELRCEYLENPEGVDARQPRLSWISDSTERGQRQTAYQVLVASSKAKLEANRGDLWDSGKVATDQSLHIRYGGQPLASHAACLWKVRVWDQAGRPGAWSAPARWSMGSLEEADWHAQWIGLEGETLTNYLAGTYWIWFPEGSPEESASIGDRFLRRTVVVPPDRQLKRVRFQYTGDNECRGWLNGRDLGARNNFHNVKDNDITYRFEPGTNVLALTGRNLGPAPKPAGVVGLLEIQFTQGEPITIATDEQWKVSDKESPGWNESGFDDSAWVAAQKLGPVGMAPWGQVRTAEDRRLAARWLRTEFAVSGKVRRAIVSYAGLGWSELYLNGEKIGDHVLSPGMTEYPKRVLYVTFDVTRQVRRGLNALGAVLGNGRYYSPRSKVYAGMQSYGFPKLLLQLRLEQEDGTVTEVVSDESWKVSADGPIVANNEYDGEEYDARKGLDGWSSAGFDDSGWRRAQVVPAPAGQLAAQMIEPIRITQTLQPVVVTEPNPGVFIFDLGQNMVGWCRIKISGPAGSEVRLRHAETLKPDGTLYLANLRGALATDTYRLAGRGTETWEPRFTYHGFRYVEVTGAEVRSPKFNLQRPKSGGKVGKGPGKVEPMLLSLEGRVVNDDLKTAGEFVCSAPLLNRIYQNIVWGTRGNYKSIPIDCPQRDERQGWLGDRSEESRGESYLFDHAALYTKWLQDMADAQKESGSVPDVCPSYWPIYSDNVTWPSSSVIIPNMLYEQFADVQAFARHYDSAKRWIDYMTRFLTNGIISKDSYGDWCVPPEDPALIHSKDPARKTDPVLLATAYFYHDLRLMEKYAKMLGRTAEAQGFVALARKVKAAFNDRFLNRDLGQYDNGTQTSSVLPLAFDLAPDEQRGQIFQRLVSKITEETQGHIGTGLIGGQYVNRVLTAHGRADLAYTIATQPDYPGWGYMLAQGATTIWELWNGDTADPTMNSGNHVMLVGDLVVWLYEDLAGIKPDPEHPGFRHLLMKPRPVGDLRFVRATHRSPYGWVRSEWRKQGGEFDWQITIPANTTATICVPAHNLQDVTEGNQPASRSRGVEFVRGAAEGLLFRVVSGRYHFVAR